MNLTISERGMKALRKAEQPDLLQRVIDASIPIRGRMIHGKKSFGDTFELSEGFDTLDNVCDRPRHCHVTMEY